MFNNSAAYKHPTIVKKIKIAALRAVFAAGKNRKGYGLKQYVENRNGRAIMRIDYNATKESFTVWGDCSADITAMILPIIENKL